MENNSFINDFADQINKVQEKIIEFLDDDQADESELKKLIDFLDSNNILVNKYNFKTFLHLISKISINHYRSHYFIHKIEQIILNFRNYIKQNLTDFEIFRYFKKSKRILLFLFEEKIIIPTKYFSIEITSEKYSKMHYPQFFYPEFADFYDENLLNSIKSNYPEIFETDLESFKQKRKTGENDLYICELIRNDSIEEFITYVSKNNFSLSGEIRPSIFETNEYLNTNSPTLIEYAAFFGAIQIFQFLKLNHVELTESLWNYAVHSNNAELILILEENHLIQKDENQDKNQNENQKYINILIESLKCHHNDLTNYIFLNLLIDNDTKKMKLCLYNLKYYNFFEFSNDFELELNDFYYFCKYDYYQIVDFYIKTTKLNFFKAIILIFEFLNEI